MNKQKLNYCPEVNILQSFGSLKANFGSLTRGSIIRFVAHLQIQGYQKPGRKFTGTFCKMNILYLF